MSENSETNDSQGMLWEVFLQVKSGANYEHQGSVHATDSEMALQNARDTFCRRGEAHGIWVVPSNVIVSSKPEDADSFFDPSEDKIYRHPQFYKISKSVNLDIE